MAGEGRAAGEGRLAEEREWLRQACYALGYEDDAY